MPAGFRLFGAAHVLAIVAIGVVTLALIVLARRQPGASVALRRALAAVLFVLTAVGLVYLRAQGVPWTELAPLHLCDAAIFVGIWALLTRRPLAGEVLYFWGASGTVLAVLTPDLGASFPRPEFLLYFGLHGAVIASALLLPFGLGQKPRPGAMWRVLLVTHLYAALVGVIDAATDSNFLYLRHKPAHASPLDAFGPWPVYLLVADVTAVVLFGLLALPFRRAAQNIR